MSSKYMKRLNVTSCLESTHEINTTKNTTIHWKKTKIKGRGNNIELKFVCVAVDV